MSWDEFFSDWFNRRRRLPRGFFFEDIFKMMKEFEDMMERDLKEFKDKVPEDLSKERTLPDGTKVKEWGPFVYGYSMKIGPDGKPQIREFGNVKPREGVEESPFTAPSKRFKIQPEREPLVDVIDTNGEVRIIAELPGVNKEAIKLQGTEKTLTISVDTPNRKYHKLIELPTAVDIKAAKSTYRNGVLEIILPKIKTEDKPKGENISID